MTPFDFDVFVSFLADTLAAALGFLPGLIIAVVGFFRGLFAGGV